MSAKLFNPKQMVWELEDPAFRQVVQKTIDFFEAKGLAKLKQDDQAAVWYEDFLDFIGDAPFVIHNAAFDIGFLNMELARIGREGFPMERATDTVLIARRKFPGAPASLDALCKRFDVDLSKRGKHGALLDCELLAAVYLELIGGRQQGFSLARSTGTRIETRLREVRPPRPHAPSDEELAAHAAMIAEIKGALWTAE